MYFAPASASWAASFGVIVPPWVATEVCMP